MKPFMDLPQTVAGDVRINFRGANAGVRVRHIFLSGHRVTIRSEEFFNCDRQIANPVPRRVIDRICDGRGYRHGSQLTKAF